MITQGYLRFPDPAKRLRVLRAKAPAQFEPPASLGNWEYFLPPEEQGPDPWCAAFGECAVVQAAAWRYFGRPIQYSERDTYAGAKALDREPGQQNGTSLDSVIVAVQPVANCTIEAQVIDDADDIPWVIHQFGAALLGLQIDEGWNDPRKSDGLITPAGRGLDGHCVVASWYNLTKRRLGGPNWWGIDWGNAGYWSMDFDGFRRQFVYGYAQRITFLPPETR